MFLEATIGVLDIEIESFSTAKLFSWIFHVIFIFFTMVQLITFHLYNGYCHPAAEILQGTDIGVKGWSIFKNIAYILYYTIA